MTRSLRDLGKDIAKVLLFIIGVSLIVAMCTTNAKSQDSTTIDNKLLEKLDFMAWKSRQLDTMLYNCHDYNRGLTSLSFVFQDIIDSTSKKLDLVEQYNTNLILENSLLLDKNTRLVKENQLLLKNSIICEKQNIKLKESNAKLKTRNTRGLFMNIGLASLLGVTVYAIATSNND